MYNDKLNHSKLRIFNTYRIKGIKYVIPLNLDETAFINSLIFLRKELTLVVPMPLAVVKKVI